MTNPEVLSQLISACPTAARMCELFLEICDVPRPSFYSEKIVAWLKSYAASKNYECTVDSFNNVYIKVPATPGCENAPSICIQGHSDIVAVWDREVYAERDPKVDPVVPRLVEQNGEMWLMGSNTSLGADNGVAIASALALAEDPSVKHGVLEILITSDEEVGLIGAFGLERNCISSPYVINADSEEEGAICLGCAGGFNFTAIHKAERKSFKGELVTMSLTGFAGGHSGVDIHQERGSAIKAFGRIMVDAIENGVDARLISVKAGIAHNAIPFSLTSELSVSDLSKFKNIAEKTFSEIAEEFMVTDPKATLRFTPCDSKVKPLTEEISQKTFRLALTMPVGPLRRSKTIPSMVESSFATTILQTTTEEGREIVKFLGSGRSSSKTHMPSIWREVESIAKLSGFEASEMIGAYPAWPPLEPKESPLCQIAQSHAQGIFGKEAHTYAIHAGLETSVVMEKCDHKICGISLGPEIQCPHSTTEKCLVPSIERYYIWMREIINGICA